MFGLSFRNAKGLGCVEATFGVSQAANSSARIRLQGFGGSVLR